MVYLICVTFSGIILFASVTNEIFQYKKLMTVEQIVKERVRDMEVYLYDISLVIKTKYLPLKLIEDCKDLMAECVKNSTRLYFEENEFY